MDYFAKKQWIRIAICAVLVAAIVLAMTGVFSGTESLKYDPSAKKLAAGESEAEAAMQGFGGDVTAHLVLEGNTVKELTIDTPNETEGLGKRASDAEFTDQFIGKDGPFTFGENGVEALSGATVTSTAALKAINKAITGEEAAEEPAAEEPAKEPEAAAADENAITATEQGFGGDVTVHVTLDGDKIQALTIDTPNETDGLGQRASEAAFTDQFVGKSGPFTYGEDGIEALTGATITSNAALKAINSVMPAAEQKEEAAPAEEPAEAIGTAAATDAAAVTATEQGFGGDVTVHVTLDGDKIQALTIDTPNETDGLGQRASEAAFTDQFVGKSGPFTYGEDGIEALTGATITSNAALKAINSVVPAAEQKEEAAATEEPAAEATAEPVAEATAEPAPEATEAPAEKAETKQEAASDGQAYAVYRATKENAFSKVTVTASAKNGALTDVKITSEGEEGKDLLTDEIRSEWAKAILESGSAAPDAITGATLKFSAGSVQEAMEEILARMNGETAAAPAEEPAAEEPKAEEPAAEEAVSETKEEPAAAAPEKVVPLYAAYRAEAENNFSKVTVIASAKNGQLTAVKILSEGEGNNDLLTDAIREEWAKAILESGSAAPDAITGATLQFSAGSVQKAMEEILAKMAGGGTAADKPAAETPAEEPKEENNTSAISGSDMLSLIAVSMGKEQENSYVTDYLEQDPYLVNIYEGYGFAKDYGSARGHSYTLTDVAKTQRPHPKANCLTCKTPDMHKMIEELGVGVYSMAFDEVMAQMTQPISCYTCHGADDGNGGKMVVTHQYVNEALGANVSEIKAASLSCGQCHIEYYFTPEDSETMMPYHSKAEMTPEAILAYYDAMGFFDWEQPGTGTKMLKAQHPELETWAYGKHAAMLSCADCHMPTVTMENGMQYHDHHLVSPLQNEVLLAKCAACHGSTENTIALVQDIQAKVTARETEVGNLLSGLKDKLTETVSAGQMGEEDLNAVRKLHREAQWFFDFCYVENSEGAHNSALAYRCLDTAETKIGEAMNLIASAGMKDVSAQTPSKEAPAEEAAAPKTPPMYAGYRVEKENAFSKITVIASARNGMLTSMKILSEGEEGKDLLTDEIKEEWAKAVLESQSAAPDAVTGATLAYSAASVQEAVTEVLDKASGR